MVYKKNLWKNMGYQKKMKSVLILLAAVICLFSQVKGHGMMIEPPNRSSMWRFGYPTPPNYSDNQNYCGGFDVQYNENNGLCGTCGDNYADPLPRANENGGTYGLGIITNTYSPGQVVPITVRLTASHKGHFEFSICSLDNISGPENEGCFQKVYLSDGSDQYPIEGGPQDYSFSIKLPAGLTCKQCSLRWHYRAGNNYGECEDGSCALGCGPQETFRNCADIAIL